jgi:hypothetical protein
MEKRIISLIGSHILPRRMINLTNLEMLIGASKKKVMRELRLRLKPKRRITMRMNIRRMNITKMNITKR